MKTMTSKIALFAFAAFSIAGCSTFDGMFGTNTASVADNRNGQLASAGDIPRPVAPVPPVLITQASPPAATGTQGQMKTFTATFNSGASRIDSDAARIVDAAVADARMKSGMISITGHADRSGDSASNMRLSEQRAKAVQDALIRAGISSSRIKQTAMGESSPAISTNDGVADSRNRRVEITIN